MGRLTLHLDPDTMGGGGRYSYASEPGFHWQQKAAGILQAYQSQAQSDGRYQLDTLLYNHPKVGSTDGDDWLIPQPRQFNQAFYASTDLANFVLTAGQQSFSPDLQNYEFEETRKADGTSYPANKWQSVYVPSGATSFSFGVNLSNLYASAGHAMPSGLGVHIHAFETPLGQPITVADYLPTLQWQGFPRPIDEFAFGFGDIGVIISSAKFIVLKSLDGGASWFNLTQGVIGSSPPSTPWGFLGALQPRFRAETRSLCVVHGLPDNLWFYPSQGSPLPVQVRQSPVNPATGVFRTGPLLRQNIGAWWIALAPLQTFVWQFSVTSYAPLADTHIYDTALPKPVTLFDLGGIYKPTIDAQLQICGIVAARVGGSAPTVTKTANQIIGTDADTGAAITVDLQDEDGVLWDSDGGHSSGNLRIIIEPSSDGYLPSALKLVDLKFPTKLANRETNPIDFADTEVISWEAESSYDDPNGKRVRVQFTSTAGQTLEQELFHQRSFFPLHVTEDFSGHAVTRVVGWVTGQDGEELTAEGPLTHYEYQGKGLLSRLDRKWLYLPQLVDPTKPGTVAHDYAIAEILTQHGIDPTTELFSFPDPYAGTQVAQLPGTWSQAPANGIATQVEAPWAPSWDEPALSYLERIAREYRGWRFWEGLDGQLYYCPEFMLYVMEGGEYLPSATLYSGKSSAAAAGYPNQYYAPQGRPQVIDPECNFVRVTGQASIDRLTPQVLDSDPLSLSDTGYESFLGEPQPVVLQNRFAVSDHACSQLARVRLRMGQRRRLLRVVEMMLAPWEVQPNNIDAGYVVTLEGKGDYLVRHCQVRWQAYVNPPPPGYARRSGNIYKTRLTLERLPEKNIAGDPLSKGPEGDLFPGASPSL